MKNNEATECEGVKTKASKMLVTEADGTEILMKLFNMIKNKFPKEWKTALTS
jgi:hypothetical protein